MSRERSGALSPDSLGPLDFDADFLDPASPLSPAIGPASPLSIPPSASSYILPNAVHMEVQENAKLATFNLPVDRSNSRGRSHSFGGCYAPATAKAIDEMIRLSENDFNLSEMFLKSESEKRANANLAYSGAGASTGRHVGSSELRSSFTGSTASDAELLVSGSAEHGDLHFPSSPSIPENPTQPIVPPRSEGLTTSAALPSPALPSKHDMQSVYPYGRRIPLPIPTKAPSPVLSSSTQGSEKPTRDPLAVAIATAAVIASHQDTSPPQATVIKPQSSNGSPGTSKSAAKGSPANGARTGVPVQPAATVAPVQSVGPSGVANSAVASTSTGHSTGGSPVVSSDAGNMKIPYPSSMQKEARRLASALPKETVPAKLPPRTATATKTQPSKPPAKHNVPPKSATAKSSMTKSATPYSRCPAPIARATPSASIQEATKRRAQFGFGGNHVVPSVPLPPTKRRPKKATARTTKQPQQRHVPPASVQNSNVAAYERKKQRAKDARIKLNDSIERLAMAINLGGTQSEQRAAQIKALGFSNAGTKTSEIQQQALQSMSECKSIAAAAKKWDRPSFVGTAATLIQELNTQCDALLGVMMEWQKHGTELQRGMACGLDETRETAPSMMLEKDNALCIPEAENEENPFSTTALQKCARVNGTSGKAVFNSQHRLKHMISRDLDMEPVPAKRQKSCDPPSLAPGGAKAGASMEDLPTSGLPNLVSDSPSSSENGMQLQQISYDDSIFSIPSVVQAIASFLDPRSLMRCSAVSKPWIKCDAFRSEDTWLDLCIQRYGLVAVRRWLEAENDNDAGSTSMIHLYRRMDRFNERPKCHHEGNVLLGDARIPGVVGAWVSMVVRSNGETPRSVRKEGTCSNPGSVGEYTSLPVVELRVLIQNIGVSDGSIIFKNQKLTVDASTRRRGEEMSDIQGDERFKMRVLNVDGSVHVPTESPDSNDVVGELCRLRLFESILLVAHIHARGCSTTSKFQKRANFARLLVTVKGTTVPLAIPFGREITV